MQKCGSCHALGRAGTAGQTGPESRRRLPDGLKDGINRDTVEGVVHQQILHPRKNSTMPAGPRDGRRREDVAAYVGFAAGQPGEDEGALRQAGLAGAKTGDQIFTAAGCAGCHKLAKAGANGNIGPSLDELAAEAGTMEPGKSAEEYVRESILEPGGVHCRGLQEGAMPSFEGRLDDKQIDALVEYLLRTSLGRPTAGARAAARGELLRPHGRAASPGSCSTTPPASVTSSRRGGPSQCLRPRSK